MSVTLIDHMDADSGCSHPDIAYLFGPLTPAVLARMRGEAAVPPTIDRALRWLADGEWTTSPALAVRLGVSAADVTGTLQYARKLGAHIEGDPKRGYRLAGGAL